MYTTNKGRTETAGTDLSVHCLNWFLLFLKTIYVLGNVFKLLILSEISNLKYGQCTAPVAIVVCCCLLFLGLLVAIVDFCCLELLMLLLLWLLLPTVASYCCCC